MDPKPSGGKENLPYLVLSSRSREHG